MKAQIYLILIVVLLCMSQGYALSPVVLHRGEMPISGEHRINYAVSHSKGSALELVLQAVPDNVLAGEWVYGWWLEDLRVYCPLDRPLVGSIYGYLNHIDLARECHSPGDLADWLRGKGIRWFAVDGARANRWTGYVQNASEFLPVQGRKAPGSSRWVLVAQVGTAQLWFVRE